MSRKIMITGGFGFIGSNLVRYWLERYPMDTVINLDGMTYAARDEWVREFLSDPLYMNKYRETLIDLNDSNAVKCAIAFYKPDHIIHLAAESHVCRSIEGPRQFFQTNVMGTFNLIEEFKKLWGEDKNHRFHHVSTDEVFGELTPDEEPFDELDLIQPRSPYAASKAASDHLVQSYHHTFKLNTVITNCSNNFGPNQHEEKLIPKLIKSILKHEEMTIYGSGKQVRDWIWVEDHVRALDCAFHEGRSGERYCIGGEQEYSNLEISDLVRKAVSAVVGTSRALKLRYTDDRPTDDFRYAIKNDKIRALGFTPSGLLSHRLEQTVRWYCEHTDWRSS